MFNWDYKIMRVHYEKWSLRKKHFWSRMWEDYEIGYLDRDLVPLLVLLNRDRDIYTTSSCSGRIVVVDGPVPWIREETSVVFKSHIPVTRLEVDFVFKKTPHQSYWLIVTGPIIHLSTASLRKALDILRKARTAGFKHSGIIHISHARGIFVELVTGVYAAQLLRTQSTSLISELEVEELLATFNNALIEGKKRLQKLYEILRAQLPENLDPYIESDLKNRSIRLLEYTPLEVFYEMCGDLCK